MVVAIYEEAGLEGRPQSLYRPAQGFTKDFKLSKCVEAKILKRDRHGLMFEDCLREEDHQLLPATITCLKGAVFTARTCAQSNFCGYQ